MQDPRERPLEKQEAADACHALLADDQSDFVGYLKLWDFYHKLKAELSHSQLRKACRQNFLSFNRMREWLDVHRELMELVWQAGLQISPLSLSGEGTGLRAIHRGRSMVSVIGLKSWHARPISETPGPIRPPRQARPHRSPAVRQSTPRHPHRVALQPGAARRRL